MKIAQIAPLAEAVPPLRYGGTERVVSWLADELVRQGHDVTLFASADSRTSARLVPCSPCGLRLAGVRDHLPQTLVMLDRIRREANRFDILHFHTDYLQFPLFRHQAGRTLTTLHGRLDLPDILPIYMAFPRMPLVSISDAQRRPLPSTLNWIATIPHGLPPSLIPFGPGGGGYLAFLGRMSPEKRPDRAIAIAERAGVPLKIAAKIDEVDRPYFETAIAPLLDSPLVEFIGEIADDRKPQFLGNALALLFPIDWPEPFGLVMIEAMAAGTPVIAWPHGSVPEVITDGVSGFVVSSVEAAAAAVDRAAKLDRHAVRQEFEERFSVARMAANYVSVYEKVLARQPRKPLPRRLQRILRAPDLGAPQMPIATMAPSPAHRLDDVQAGGSIDKGSERDGAAPELNGDRRKAQGSGIVVDAGPVRSLRSRRPRARQG